MALLSFIPDPDLAPERAIVRALQELDPALAADRIESLCVHSPRGLGVPTWRWKLARAPLQDPEVTIFPGAVDGGQWKPTGPATPAEIRRGIAIQVEGGWVVAAAHPADEDDDLAQAEQALAHVAAVNGAE